ncbi:transposase family protein [Streptomyces cinerochromogenes]|uniref:transposase family protein n=1 Tax=Streptomyces cinerochromogenes TaxID=66422 RepID=UPI0033AED801
MSMIEGVLMVDAAGCGPPGLCPDCAQPVTRVRSRYWSHVTDLPVAGQRMVIRLQVRRFLCERAGCRRRTLVEQVRGLTEPRRRTTTSLRSAMRAVATELGGRPGQRLCRQLLLHGGRTALLRLLKAPSIPDRAPRILGIDEFAFRKGRTYGTVLVDTRPPAS